MTPTVLSTPLSDPVAPRRTGIKPLRWIIAWLIALTVLVALGFSFLDFTDLSRLRTIPLEAVIATIALTAMMDLVYAARWRLWLDDPSADRSTSILDLWTFVSWSRITSQVLPPPAGNLGVRAAALKSTSGMTVKRALCAVSIDPLFDLYQFALIAPVTIALLAGWCRPMTAAIAIGIMLVAGAVLLMNLFPILVFAVGYLRRWLAGRRGLDSVTEFDLPAQLNRRTILTAYALTVLRYALVVARLVVTAYAVGIVILPASFFIAAGPVTQAAHMATLTPGALGVLEGGWFAVLRWVGVAAETATLFVAAQRILIWCAIAVSASALTAVFYARRMVRGAADERLAGTGAGA